MEVGELAHSCTAGMPECSWENQKPGSGTKYVFYPWCPLFLKKYIEKQR